MRRAVMAFTGGAALVAAGATSALAASTGGETVTSVDGTRFVVASGTYTYDDNDQLLWGAGGPAVSVDRFYATLDVGSLVQVVSYSADPAGVSTFAVLDVAAAQPSSGQSAAETLAYTGPAETAAAVTGAALVAAGWGLLTAARMRNAGRHVLVETRAATQRRTGRHARR